MKYCLILIVAFLIGMGITKEVSSKGKPRVIVLSDISGLGEPDDFQSFIRFLLYGNEFDVEGIIGTGSIFSPGRGYPEYFHQIIDQYALIRENLLIHAKGYPKADDLKKVVRSGQRGTVGMDGVGDGRSTPGSDLILKVLEKKDSRPVWLCMWGGTGTLAQALWEIKNNTSYKEDTKKRMILKIRVYDIGGQDNAGGWLMKNFPEIFYIRSSEQFLGFAQGHKADAQGGDLSLADDQWFKEHIMGKGPYGSIYPKRKYMYEGDSPSFMHLLPNGLSDPEKPHYGGWGGRFGEEQVRNAPVYHGAGKKGVDESSFHDFYMYNDAPDQWACCDTAYNNVYCALFRWRAEYQNDFAARNSWTYLPYKEANHNPVAVVKRDNSKDVLTIKVKPGQDYILDASRSSDPDKDQLFFHWFFYKEPSSYKGEIDLKGMGSSKLTVNIPSDAKGKNIHIILRIQDSGSPSLFTYRRIIFLVKG